MTHQSLRPDQKAVRTEDTDRILRMFARFTSIGYVAYLVILWPSITELAPRMDPWWTPTMVVVVFGSGLIPRRAVVSNRYAGDARLRCLSGDGVSYRGGHLAGGVERTGPPPRQ